MKKYVLFFTAVLLLVACGGNDGVDSDNTVDEIETLSSEDINLKLVEDDNVVIELEVVNHGRDSVNDFISLHTTMTNKQDRTYEMYLKDLSVDGTEVNDMNIWLDEGEIGPEETKSVIVNGYDSEELTLIEHVAGVIIYKDYEGNRYELEFNEYINE